MILTAAAAAATTTTLCDGLLSAHHTIRSENTHQFLFINGLNCVWLWLSTFNIKCDAFRDQLLYSPNNERKRNTLKLNDTEKNEIVAILTNHIFRLFSCVALCLKLVRYLSLAGESVNCVHATISSFITIINWFRVDWIALNYQLMFRMLRSTRLQLYGRV